METSSTWEEIKSHLKPETRLTGIVTKHFPFGMFVALPGIEFTGLVQIPDVNDEGDMNPNKYPAVGSSVDVVVIGFKETGQQIWLSMKPSLVHNSKFQDE